MYIDLQFGFIILAVQIKYFYSTALFKDEILAKSIKNNIFAYIKKSKCLYII